MECRHTASNTHKISLGNPKRVSFLVPVFLTPTFSIKLSSLWETEKEVPVLP